MNDQIYQSVKWIAIGILLGYFGKYALALAKTKLAQQKEDLEAQEEQTKY